MWQRLDGAEGTAVVVWFGKVSWAGHVLVWTAGKAWSGGLRRGMFWYGRQARSSIERSEHATMKIPNPRKFIEIALCFIVASVILSCMVLVVIVLAVFAGIEAVVDRFKPRRVRR